MVHLGLVRRLKIFSLVRARKKVPDFILSDRGIDQRSEVKK
jgi:hypothetical protein